MAEIDTDFDGVVVGVDGSSRDTAAVLLAAREASARRLPLRVVHVQEFAPPVLDVLAWTPQQDQSPAYTVLRTTTETAAGAEPALTVTAAVLAGRPENVLHRLSRSARLIVVGTGRRTGAAQFRYGTVSLNVAAHAECPVLVIGEPAPTTPRGRVVVGVDGSRHSVGAVRAAAEQARLHDAELVVHTSWSVEVVDGLVVTEPGSAHWREVEQRLRHLQQQVVVEALPDADGPPISYEIVKDTPLGGLVAASEDADCVVVGSRGRGGFLGKLLGSVTMGLLQHCPCPVLVTREH
ncbi:MAG: universal stress protein [Dermatophilaceae bacterium]